MNLKNIVIATILGGIVYTIIEVAFDSVFRLPETVFAAQQMGLQTQPKIILVLLFPFVFALMAAFVFDSIKNSMECFLTKNKGLIFGLILFTLLTIPQNFAAIAFLSYPPLVYVLSLLKDFINYMAIGLLYAKIWKV